MRFSIVFVTIGSVMAAVGAHGGENHPNESSPSSMGRASTTTLVSSTHQTVVHFPTLSSAISTSTKINGSHVSSVIEDIDTTTYAITSTAPTTSAPTTKAPSASTPSTRNMTQSTKELVTVTSAPGFNGSNHTTTPSFSPVPTSSGGISSPFGAALFAVAVAGIMCLGF